ncbi:MAG TPA: aldehyde dehydrogenase family protein [Thermoanaerobaculia bacterium]|nr:aldehyde dehydrogenase family protein [Thermoanaerobaculia bacterium]
MTLASDSSVKTPQIVTGSRRTSSRAELDEGVALLQENKGAWTEIGPRERRGLLGELIESFLGVADRWAVLGIEAEGLDPQHPGSAEEALTGPYLILRNLRLLREALLDIETHGRPRIPGAVRTRANGQVTARVFPLDLYDRVFYSGVSADVWMEPGVTEASLPSTQAVAYHAPVRQGRVALVLGGGNVSSIAPMDAFYKLFVEDQVVVLKTHPVNEYLGPLFEEAFSPLIARGFLRVVYGGAEEGAYLCEHPGVDEIHITGSDKTYEAIVFGPGEEGRRRKAANEPRLSKRFTAELGNVSPVIVVPGPWSEGDLDYHAENLATMLTNNAGFNCNASRVMILDAGWALRERLLGKVRDVLRGIATRRAYYPGAADRFESFLAAHRETAEQFGERKGDRLPWMLIPGLDATKKDDICFTTEAFTGVFGELALKAKTTAEYLDQAVDFCNTTLWGTLNVTLVVHPESLKNEETAMAFERALETLRYGTISINHWAGVGYGLVVNPWGAFPGHTPEDIRSGVGFVHNTLMFDRPQKTVIRAPFRVFPKPVWFATHKTAHLLTPKLVRFEASPSMAKLPGILSLAVRG